MKAQDLIETEGTIYRVLAKENRKILLIDCMRQSTPHWCEESGLGDYKTVTETYLLEKTGMAMPNLEDTNPKLRSTAFQRYTAIVGILPVIGDNHKRLCAIRESAEIYGMSKQSVRKYLWQFLVFQSVAALMPAERGTYQKPMTEDEKNFRWAINKYYYTAHRNSLMDAYTYMLKARYCDENGKLFEQMPSFNQFRYFYAKYKKKQSVLISREGMKKYQRDYRPLLGDRMQDFANHVGIGEIDATICDIHLVDDYGNYLGRPILTILSDSFSNGFVYGYSLTLEGGTYSLRNLLLNCLTDKAGWCRRFGIFIEQEDWNTSGFLPGTIVSDMGGEYQSYTFSQITELGITLINLPPLRPELKSIVERSFQLIQTSMKPALFDYGFVDKDYGKRLAKDSRKEAVLTLREYEKCVIYSILYHNNQRVIEDYPYTEEMLNARVEPHPRTIFEWGRKQDGANLIPVLEKELVLTLLPRTMGKFSRKGLIVFGLRYDSTEGKFTEEYLSGGDALAAYNPDSVESVYLFRNGAYTEFRLIESRFMGKSFSEVQKMMEAQRALVNDAMQAGLQGKIDLASNLEAVVTGKVRNDDVNLKNVRATRTRERRKEHRNFMDEVKQEVDI